MLTPAQLSELGPQRLTNLRATRYQGADVCSDLLAFHLPDRERIQALYHFLTELLEIVSPPAKEERAAAAPLGTFLDGLDLEKFATSVLAIGSDSTASDRLGALARTAHDLRGGSLTTLLCELYTARFRLESEALTRSLFLLTRDHLKIMRNALVGLDDERRNADLRPVIHTASLFNEKWDGAEIKLGERVVKVQMEHAYEGAIAESCVEFGAIDRVLYNLMNNAARHAVNDEVQLSIFPQPTAENPEDLRFAVVNEISPADLAGLRARSVNGELRFLFEAGVSTTGSGLGMSIVADFVSNAYGLANIQRALDKRYFGACLVEDHFAAWFHWPITQNV